MGESNCSCNKLSSLNTFLNRLLNDITTLLWILITQIHEMIVKLEKQKHLIFKIGMIKIQTLKTNRLNN